MLYFGRWPGLAGAQVGRNAWDVGAKAILFDPEIDVQNMTWLDGDIAR